MSLSGSNFALKGLGRQLSMRIRGAKFKFPVDHGKFNFPPLYAEIEPSGRNPIVTFAIATIIFFEEILYIFRPLREKMASRKTEVRGLVGRPMLSTEYALFLRLR